MEYHLNSSLAVDIVNGKWNYLSEGDKEYTWLINNSYKYGFILRYNIPLAIYSS